jgi:hypothetical protein
MVPFHISGIRKWVCLIDDKHLLNSLSVMMIKAILPRKGSISNYSRVTVIAGKNFY